QFLTRLQTSAVTRRVCTGYSVKDSIISGEGSTYTLQANQDTEVTFNWRTEHTLEIKQNLISNDQTSTDVGSPNPYVGKHWVAEGDMVTAFVDGWTVDPYQPGARYVVSSFNSTGSASPGASFQVQKRQQVPQFIMKGPAIITYNWKKQFRISISTS